MKKVFYDFVVLISLITLTLIVLVWEPSSQVYFRYVLNASHFRLLTRWPNNVIVYRDTEYSFVVQPCLKITFFFGTMLYFFCVINSLYVC